MDRDSRMKHEILSELRASQLRWYRNAAALAGLALLVGCTMGLNILAGGIVAGILLVTISVSGMILSRKAETKEKEPER